MNDGSHNYTYDAENRLITVDTNVATYSYDGQGRRMTRTTSSGVLWNIYDLSGRVVARVNPNQGTSGVIVNSDTYAGRHLAAQDGTTTYFPLADWLGTTRMTTNLSGASTETCINLPFGDGRTCTGTDPSQIHFTGQVYDSESNTDHFLARQYTGTQGHWMSPDPAGLAVANPADPQSWDRYAYVGNNPTSAVDPLGLDGCDGPGDPDCCLFNPSLPWCLPPCNPDDGGGDCCDPNDPFCGEPFPPTGGGGGGGGGGGFPTGAGGSRAYSNWPNGETLGLPGGLNIHPLGDIGTLFGLLPNIGCGDFIACGSLGPFSDGFIGSGKPHVPGTGLYKLTPLLELIEYCCRPILRRKIDCSSKACIGNPPQPAQLTPADVQTLCTIYAINQNNGFGASGNASIWNGITFKQYTQYRNMSTLNPSSSTILLWGVLASPSFGVQQSFYQCKGALLK